MRIIAGEARGRKLKTVKGLKTRPTADRVKESLFSILTPVLAEAKFLDLFAGTGSIGMEAISRGAAFCVFVDSWDACTRVIRENLALCGFNERAQVHRNDALAYLKRAALEGECFDLIYVDPPYDTDLAKKALDQIGIGSILAPAGRVILETRKDSHLKDASVYGLERTRQTTYGDTMLVFYQQAEMPEGDSY